MAGWDDLETELDLWKDTERPLEFWWRDDDAVAPSSALERLLSVTKGHNVPVGLAVIPQKATPELVAHLQDEPQVQVLQHGFAHINHAPQDEKKQEFGPHRNTKSMLNDVFKGAEFLKPFANRCPVFVPPWNRIDARLLAVLPGLGVRGISAFAPRAEENAVPGLAEVNTHIDPVNWHVDRGYAGDEAVISQIISHLEQKRTGLVDADEPAGLLTHHLVHDEACWTFVARLLDLTCNHGAVKWLSVNEAFGFDK